MKPTSRVDRYWGKVRFLALLLCVASVFVTYQLSGHGFVHIDDLLKVFDDRSRVNWHFRFGIITTIFFAFLVCDKVITIRLARKLEVIYDRFSTRRNAAEGIDIPVGIPDSFMIWLVGIGTFSTVLAIARPSTYISTR